MKRRYANILCFAIGFLLGPICLKVTGAYDQITFDPSFNFGNVIWALTTLFAAVLLASHLQRQTHSDRAEKELLLRQFDQLLSVVAEFEKFKEGGVLTDVNASLKKLSMKCTSINSVLAEVNCPENVSKASKFQDLIRSIRTLATDTPIRKIQQHATKAKCTSEVRDGIIKLASEKSSLLDSKIAEFRTRIIKAQLAVNRM